MKEVVIHVHTALILLLLLRQQIYSPEHVFSWEKLQRFLFIFYYKGKSEETVTQMARAVPVFD